MATAKPNAFVKTPTPPARFRLPDPPERQDDEKMSTVDHLHQPGNTHHLAQHLGNPDTTLVTAERFITLMPERRLPSGRTRRVPDLLVAFDVDPELYRASNGYIVQEQSKAPDFVLEVASRSTGDEDTGPKRDDYAALGILEYWRFDPTGEFHGAKLAGDRLDGEEYVAIDVEESPDGSLQGYSAALNLHLRWQDGRLLWIDPATGVHISTFDTERAGRLQEQARADRAEAAAAAAEARVRELEALLRRQHPDNPDTRA